MATAPLREPAPAFKAFPALLWNIRAGLRALKPEVTSAEGRLPQRSALAPAVGGHRDAPVPIEFWRLSGCSSTPLSDLGESERRRRPVRCVLVVAGCAWGPPATAGGSALKAVLSVLELLAASALGRASAGLIGLQRERLGGWAPASPQGPPRRPCPPRPRAGRPRAQARANQGVAPAQQSAQAAATLWTAP